MPIEPRMVVVFMVENWKMTLLFDLVVVMED